MKEILKKYNIRAPRYTSYPPANKFKDQGFSRQETLDILEESNSVRPENISLYVHFPYCPQRCYFCGCNSYLEKSPEKSEEYVKALLKEMELVFDHLDLSRPVTQIHWGGGTPNSLDYSLIEKVMSYMLNKVNLDERAEIAMECNPAYLKKESVKSLRSMGFNRLSLGIQDFDNKVLKAVNREPSLLPVEELMGYIRNENFEGVNFDFIYGLPLQTLESFLNNLDIAAKLRPERLVTFSYAHVPWVKEEQKVLESLKFPTPENKLDMLLGGMEKMKSSGYNMVGMDHYALPEDILGRASERGQLHRNFQGYCTRETTGQVYAFGASAISQLEMAYLQNTRNPESYINAINQNGHAVERGYQLSDREHVIRATLTELMCNGTVDFKKMSLDYKLGTNEFKSLFSYNPESFKDMQDDGLLVASDDFIELGNAGKLLSRVVASRLDPEIDPDKKGYSLVI